MIQGAASSIEFEFARLACAEVGYRQVLEYQELVTTVMSGQKYSTLLMQPKNYELMVMHCKNTIDAH
jgi:hypothetical protein